MPSSSGLTVASIGLRMTLWLFADADFLAAAHQLAMNCAPVKVLALAGRPLNCEDAASEVHANASAPSWVRRSAVVSGMAAVVQRRRLPLSPAQIVVAG